MQLLEAQEANNSLVQPGNSPSASTGNFYFQSKRKKSLRLALKVVEGIRLRYLRGLKELGFVRLIQPKFTTLTPMDRPNHTFFSVYLSAVCYGMHA